jgi:hypothetical protein
MDFRKEPLLDSASAWIVVGWLFLHASALAAAWGSRVAAGSRLEPVVQLACFLAMAAVGTAAWIGSQHENNLSILSGITLVAMVVTAVVDFRRTHEIHPVLHSAANS